MSNEIIEQLPERFNQDGFTFRLIERDEKSCIYGKAIGTNIPGNFTIDIYECWQRRVSRGSSRKIGEDTIEYKPKETKASDEAFGKYAYTGSLDRMREICSGIKRHSSTLEAW